MKKISTLLYLLLVSSLLSAQKADISSEKIPLSFELPNYFKNIKTFSYEIQDDGAYWNYTPSPENYPVEEYPNLAALADEITIDNLEKVNENADLKIVVGFLGNQLGKNNNLIVMKGTVSILFFVKGDKLAYGDVHDIQLSQLQHPEKFPMDTRDERNQTKAKMLTTYAQKYIEEMKYLFVENSKFDLPFAMYKKVNGGAAEEFNIASKPLIEAIVSNPTDAATLDEAIEYWKSQITVDFGKKVKDKVKNKVIYANLASASILKNDNENTTKYVEVIKNNTGFFDLWKEQYTTLFDKRKLMEKMLGLEPVTVKGISTAAYYITLDEGGTYTYKNKEIKFSKIDIERFVPSKDSGMASLNTTEKPKIFIYEDGVKTLVHMGSDKNKIITNGGEEIIFKKERGAFRPFLKETDGNYTIYQNN